MRSVLHGRLPKVREKAISTAITFARVNVKAEELMNMLDISPSSNSSNCRSL